jgi:hypothetical protein
MGEENERERQAVRALSRLRSCARFGLPGRRIQRKQPPAPKYSAPEPLGPCFAVHQACDPFRLGAAAGQGAGLAAAAQPRLVTPRAALRKRLQIQGGPSRGQGVRGGCCGRNRNVSFNSLEVGGVGGGGEGIRMGVEPAAAGWIGRRLSASRRAGPQRAAGGCSLPDRNLKGLLRPLSIVSQHTE